MFVVPFYLSNNKWKDYGYFFTPVFLGVLFFWMRTRAKASYGLFEVILGLVISTQVLPHDLRNVSQLLDVNIVALLSAIYVIVRGLDNIDKAITSEWGINNSGIYDPDRLSGFRRDMRDCWKFYVDRLRPKK